MKLNEKELIKSFTDFGEKMHQIIFSRPIAAENMSISQLKALCFLEKKENIKMKDITEELSIASSSATEIIDKLIKEDLVERYRDQDDRRVVRVKVTEKAKSFLDEAKERKRKFWESVLKKFTEEERTELLKYSKKFYNIISKMADEGIYF